MDKTKKKLTRRGVLQGASGLLVAAVTKPPVAKLLEAPVTAVTATVEEEIIQLYPFIKSLFLVIDKHSPVRLIEEQDLDSPEEGWTRADNDECYGGNLVFYPSKYWTRMRLMQVEWANRIVNAADNLRLCDEFQEAIAKSDSNQLSKLASLTENYEDFKGYLQMLEVLEKSAQPLKDDVIQHRLTQSLARITRLIRGMTLFDAGSPENVIPQWRQEITEFLSSPLEDGCLDRLARRPERMHALKYLLRQAPELFPADKLHIFRQIAMELEVNGCQTTPIKNMLGAAENGLPQSEWRLQALHLAYRWGATDAEIVWPAEKFSPSLSNLIIALEKEWAIPAREITYKYEMIKINSADVRLAARPVGQDNDNIVSPILGF